MTASRTHASSGDPGLARRPALDGLRGVAVLAVLAYHLGLPLGGGFLGVDIFFVLSGFLIGSLLDAELSTTGRINLPRFWARRARRLLPALVIVGVAVALWVHSTGDWETWSLRRDDLLATFGYVANWHFVLADTDYFAATSGASPLLHTWSLAVEEQFYLLWPLLFIAATWLGGRVLGRRRTTAPGRGRPVAILVAALVATISVLLVALLFDPAAPSRAYYGTDTRIHQILIGVLLALLLRPWATGGRSSATAPARGEGVDHARVRPRGRSDRLPVLGSLAQLLLIGALGFGLVYADPTSQIYYDGGSLAVALLVAALILSVERVPRGVVSRLLASRPLVAFGTISYGLYLWHWPVIVATAPPDPTTDTLPLLPLRIALSVGLAAVMFVLIERPIREGRLPIVRRGSWRTLAAAAAALVLAANVSIAETDLGNANLLGSDDSSSVSSVTSDSGATGDAGLGDAGSTALPSPSPAGSGGRTKTRTSSPAAPTPAPSIDVVHTEAEIQAAMNDFEHWQCPSDYQICTKVQGPPGALTVVTFGDSSIGSMDVGMTDWAQQAGVTYILGASGGCSASGQPRSDDPGHVKKGAMDGKCEDRYGTIVNQIASLPTPLLVLISDVSENRSIVLSNGSVAPFGTSAHRAAVESGLDALVRRFNRPGVTVVLMAPAAHTLKPKCSVPTSSGDCALAQLNGDWIAQAQVGGMFADIANRYPSYVKLIQLGDIVCPGGGPCTSWQGNLLLRWDGIHYTRPGSRFVVAAIIRRLKQDGLTLPNP